ncbi:MAG: hypothetical protein IJW11_05060 [Clostridia bacterium]|nr:hypothetical protein [Clostridia bacterium]
MRAHEGIEKVRENPCTFHKKNASAQNDVMFAHYAVKRNITYVVNIIAGGNIICPQGQTSFGAPALSQVAVSAHKRKKKRIK